MLPRTLISSISIVAALLIELLGATSARGQLPPPMPDDLPMQSILYDAAWLSRSWDLSGEELADALLRRGIALRSDGKVHVEIVGPEGWPAIDRDLLAKFGADVDNIWRHRTDVWIPIGQLQVVAEALPAGYFLRRAAVPGFDEVIGEGPGVVNSAGYANGGADGTGLLIAVIDFGYAGLTAARNNGDAPLAANTTELNYTGHTFQDPNDGDHGTGCVEAAFDHCPGATWRLYKVDSLTDVGTAVSDAVSNNVDIISHSISWYNTGWADDSGDACAAAGDAAQHGIMFVTSAGNRAEQHWQGTFNPGGGDPNWHDFASGDETITIDMPPRAGGDFYLSWNRSGGTFDYDLYLYDDPPVNVLASSTNSGNTYEEFRWVNSGTTTRRVNLVVEHASGGNTDFELFLSGAGDWLEHIIANGSTASPSNSTAANVISNGAVDWGDFGSPPGSVGIIQPYSSRGPSNSGMTLPDICGPTNTTGFTYPSGFGGTSSATANNAGAACAFWSAHPQFSADAVGWLLFEQAQIYRDWGTAGADNTYGRGGLRFVDFHVGTVWAARSYGNVSDDPSAPYYHVGPAHDAAPSGGRILFVGGWYTELITLSKALTLQTIGAPAVLGE